MYPKPKGVRFSPKKKRSSKMQEACIKRDGRCMICGIQDDTLVGHHIVTYGSSGIDELYNLICLCTRCHDNAHKGFIDCDAWLSYVGEPGKKIRDPVGVFTSILSKKYAYL